jgi:uncharacterized protein YeaO (DUF488 family)
MTRPLQLSTFRIGSPAKPEQGLRIGVTRHPPRGVPKSRWVADGYFDAWLPTLAPNAKLVTQIRALAPGKTAERKRLFDRYERQLLADAAGRQTVELLAQIATRMPISIGCFCQEESLCHRSRLLRILKQHAEADPA